MGVRIGQPRGGGCVVSIKAKHAESGEWHRVYVGPAQRRGKKYANTNGNGLYFVFDEPICKPAFLTRELRIEMDTSAETGKYRRQEHGRLRRAGRRAGPAGLRAATRVLYVPRANESGRDAFRFQATDCLGKPERSSETRTVLVDIAASQDAPVVTPAAPKLAFRCGVDSVLEIDLLVVELNGDNVTEAGADPALGSLLVSEPVARGRPAGLARVRVSVCGTAAALGRRCRGRGAARSRSRRVFRRSRCLCRRLCRPRGVGGPSPGSAIAAVEIVVRVTDSAGNAAEGRVAVAVLREDRGLLSKTVVGVCGAMFVVNITLALVAAAWTVVNRRKTIVHVSQIHFLLCCSWHSAAPSRR